MSSISKSFGAVRALDAVDLEVAQGGIHALVGENGAGKTTLMRILFGALTRDAGIVEVDGEAVNFRNSADAISTGVGMVSQHYAIIPGLNCLQNLILGAEPGALLDLRSARLRADEISSQMGFNFDWDEDAGDLTPAQSQKLEILKLLWKRARIMILDEPTAMLAPADADLLFESLRQLVEQGSTVILVTHRLPEVIRYCQSVTVLRAGRVEAALKVSDTDADELATMIVGGELAISPPVERSFGLPFLTVSGLTVIGSRGDEAVKNASFVVREGEVVGIAGVDGSGQQELIESLVGVRPIREGQIIFGDHSVDQAPTKERLRLGLRLLPADRHQQGVIEGWSIEMNAELGLQGSPSLRRGGRINKRARRSLAIGLAERFGTRHGGLNLPIASLSGGNQQRFVAARSLALDPKLLIAFQPTRGLDINGTLAVYSGIREACAEGACAVIVGFDLDELMDNCDRVAVMYNGVLTEPPAKDRETIGRLMVGAA